jgi:tetratricopeptide (TPR) repeat protein
MRPAPSIEKLENRLAADPASKVFVPLAEEYRKAGEIDRAVELLRSGLEKDPEYAAAEVALARALLQKDEREECRRILTRVTRRVPDNLLAEKLLSEAGGPLETEEPPADVEEAVSDQEDETDQAAEDDRSAEVGNDTEEMTTPLPDGPLWSSPASVEKPPEPATPEPGVWKSDEESEEPTFDTVMISREDLEPRREAEPEAPDVPAEEPSVAVAEETDTTSGDDEQAVQMAE